MTPERKRQLRLSVELTRKVFPDSATALAEALDYITELESSNAAEKAAALRELLIWLKPRWIEAHDYIARFYPPGAARTPAPDAKGAVK